MRKIFYIICLMATFLTIGCKDNSDKEQIEFIRTVFTEFDSISNANPENYTFYTHYRLLCKKYCTEEFRSKLMNAYSEAYGCMLVAGYTMDENSLNGMTIEMTAENVFRVRYETTLDDAYDDTYDQTTYKVDLQVTLCKEKNEYKIANVENFTARKLPDNREHTKRYYIDDLMDSISRNPQLDNKMLERLHGYWLAYNGCEDVTRITQNTIERYSLNAFDDGFKNFPYILRNQVLYISFCNDGRFYPHKCTFDKDTLRITSCSSEYANWEMFHIKDKDASPWIEYIKKARARNALPDSIKIEIGTFDSFPDEIDGGSCEFFRNEDDMKAKKFVMVNDLAETAYVVINNKLEKFTLKWNDGNLYSYANQNYVLRVNVIKLKDNTAPDSHNLEGSFWIIDPDERHSESVSFIGRCGC